MFDMSFPWIISFKAFAPATYQGLLRVSCAEALFLRKQELECRATRRNHPKRQPQNRTCLSNLRRNFTRNSSRQRLRFAVRAHQSRKLANNKTIEGLFQ